MKTLLLGNEYGGAPHLFFGVTIGICFGLLTLLIFSASKNSKYKAYREHLKNEKEKEKNK